MTKEMNSLSMFVLNDEGLTRAAGAFTASRRAIARAKGQDASFLLACR
jgi:hypothetical protein